MEEVKQQRFREDLYYRLYGLQIKLPALRERENDILLLAKYFAESFCKENGMAVKQIANDAQQKLLAYNYAGNVRELKSVIELASVMSNDEHIKAGDIIFSDGDLSGELLSQEMTLEQYEKKIILHYLEKCDNNVIEAAQKLGIGKSTIYRMLNREKQE